MTLAPGKNKSFKNFLVKASALFDHQSIISVLYQPIAPAHLIDGLSDHKKVGKKSEKMPKKASKNEKK